MKTEWPSPRFCSIGARTLCGIGRASLSAFAVVARPRELTELLFQSGMNPNLTGWLGVTPLHRFARQGDVEKAAIFLDHGANVHARDEEFCTTPLGYAAGTGKLRMVEFLLRRGAKLTLPDDLA